MKQSLNEYITEMRYPTALIIVQTTDLFIYSFIFTCGDFFYHYMQQRVNEL